MLISEVNKQRQHEAKVAFHLLVVVGVPSLWNTLPVHLKNRNLTLTTFMRHLKSYLFSQY